MQRYRINYSWLIGVVASFFVLAASAYFVWSWQVERRAGDFLRRADEALAQDDQAAAFNYFGKYVRLRPEEEEARIKMASAALEVAKSPGANLEERMLALGTLAQTVRTTDDPGLRRELAEIMMQNRRPQDAIQHVEDLLADNPQDPELNALLIRGYFQAKDKRVKQMALGLIGYDKATDEFDLDKALLKGEPDVYSLLAEVLFQKDKNEELARRVIDQMVEVNPDSAQANLRKSVFLASLKEFEGAGYLDKAYELDPKDAAIITRKGMAALYGFLYKETKEKYLDAISNYEKAVAELISPGSEALDNDSYAEVKANFEEAIANLENTRPNYEESRTNFEEAKSSFSQAIAALAPKDLAIQADSDFKSAQESFNEAQSEFDKSLPNYEAAKQHFSEGLKEHPDNTLFYRFAAEVENRLGNSAAAMKILDKGILAMEKTRSIDLVIFKIDLLMADEDYAGVAREIKRIAQLNRPDLQPIIDFQEARVLFRQQKWSVAARELKRVRPLLYNWPSFQVLAGTMLGVCYERQGIPDLAIQAYTMVLDDFPEHQPAQLGLARVRARINPGQAEGVELDQVVNKTLELPKAEQDWDKVNELVEQVITERELEEARANLLRAKVLMKREMYEEAEDLIRRAAKDAPDDIDINFAAVLLVLSNPEQGPAVAMKTLDRLEKKWGVSLRSLAQRADLLVRLNPDDVVEQLRSLETASNELTDPERLRLQNVLGLKFEQLGKIDEAREYYEKSAAQEANNLPLRMRLFDLALRQQDDAAMKKAQQAILEFVKSKNDASYLLTEVKRQIMSFGRQEIDRTELAAARELLDKALLRRPDWHELHITYGQLLLLLGGDIDLALQHFDDALESGPAKSNAVNIQVKLLVERGLYKKARERMELLAKELRGRLLGRLEAEILVKTGDTAGGFAAAKRLAESQPNNSMTQIWFSKIAQQTGELDVAASALRKALRMNSADPDGWLRLIGLYTEQRDFDEVQSVIREAHLSSDGEFLPLLTGKYYELLSRWQDAESIYVAAYADQLDRLSICRRMADFYLLWSAKDPANVDKAAAYINRILRAANEGKAASDNPHVVWARQRAARILFAKNDYQQSLKAERLLRQSAVNNVMNIQESLLLADILNSRGDPQSLMQAKELLTNLRTSGRLPKQGALQLARILSQANQWSDARNLLFDLITEDKTDPAVQTTFIELLIDQREYSSAENRIKRLRNLDAKNPLLVPLSARLASERGDQVGLNRLLTSLVPKKAGAMSEAELRNMLGIAQLAERYGDYELAGNLFKVYTNRVPADVFQLARFQASHGDCDQALELMRRLFPDQMDQVIQLASRMISKRRDEVGDKYDEAVDRMIDAAVRDDPDSVSRLLIRAEAYDTQGRYEQSIATYDQLLQRDDLSTRLRAAAMNNLGFQLGLLNKRVDEAEQLINEAMETFGPVADMLDTRAVIRIAQQKYDLAIEDMELALSVSQDPVKYFHLAKACILAGDGQAALNAWKKAQELGFEKDSLPKLEKDSFEQILQKIESFETQNAKL